MSDAVIVFVTAGSDEEAVKIGKALVEEKLVACCNLIPRIRSIYWWKGEVCEEEERLLILKTQAALFPAVQSRVRELHSYDVPEIIALPIERGLPDYLTWIAESTRKGD